MSKALDIKINCRVKPLLDVVVRTNKLYAADMQTAATHPVKIEIKGKSLASINVVEEK